MGSVVLGESVVITPQVLDMSGKWQSFAEDVRSRLALGCSTLGPGTWIAIRVASETGGDSVDLHSRYCKRYDLQSFGKRLSFVDRISVQDLW